VLKTPKGQSRYRNPECPVLGASEMPIKLETMAYGGIIMVLFSILHAETAETVVPLSLGLF